ncbi:MAG: hypothetical protein JWP63_939 [Candidatus Solibacter sp.]|nr:hypothetical protein [Candidatus Solibacter sp.]
MAQNWELGGGVGYGAYRNGSISGTAGTATAGVRNQYAVTGMASEDLFEHFSGEVRYVYHPGDTFLESGAAKGSVEAYSHTFTYDVLFHFKPRESKVRPFVVGGAGAKYYSVTGTLPRPQPVPAIAGLTTRSQWEPAFDFGGGVKVRVAEHVVVSGFVRDYVSLFPDHLFVPTGGAKASSVLHQVTPMVEIGYRF